MTRLRQTICVETSLNTYAHFILMSPHDEDDAQRHIVLKHMVLKFTGPKTEPIFRVNILTKSSAPTVGAELWQTIRGPKNGHGSGGKKKGPSVAEEFAKPPQ